ncbi:lamin tail domain-containing protein [Jiangella mangrovi]|uniref:LPXTG-motif cell wall-anchored protein n=1 Tax=Jiangella mangrovi TaxID=1524084 RepID=A0A7W9GKT1_9ACTN|nr:lamin tail domain-containing protein [Jiangella mangrovi]MBB5785513.1 LPXTG-motif cell wall-anchored protein [Jiangella mangrovi]
MSARKAHGAGVAVLAAAGLAPLVAAVTPGIVAAAADTEVSGVVINEVSQRVNPDWVEFHNTGDEAADLSGWKFQDDQDRGPEDYVFPPGTVIPAGWYLVLDAAEGDTRGFEFGLGAEDTVRLSDPTGTLVDSLSWTEHAATTYGRCPDGTGEVRLTAAPTRGEANDCSSPARINEVASGFVELVNPTDADLDLSGVVVRAAGADDGYVVTAGGVIRAGGFASIDVSVLPFAPSEVDGIELVDADGTVVDEQGWDTLPAPSLGRCPDATGPFAVTASATPSAANDCVPVAGQDVVKVNEVESDEGDPGDWIELVNTGAEAVDLSGWLVRDSDDTRFSTIPDGTVVEAGGFYVHEETALGFGLGGGDQARLYTPNGTLADSYTWEEHAATTYGRCPDGTGEFRTTTTPTKGAANDCGPAVRINEIESSDGEPSDWVELANPSAEDVDIAGFQVKDDDDTHVWTAPAGTVVPAGGHYVVEETDLDFGLGGADTVRLFAADGSAIDSYAWADHAATTYGRCPDGTGAFAVTVEPTKGAVNSCEGDAVPPAPWPGGPAVTVVDAEDAFDGDLSGIDYAPSGTAEPGVLWAVDNGRGRLHRLEWDGTVWANSTDDGWSAGKPLHYPGGVGTPDSEGVTVTGDGSVVVGTERDNDADDVSQLSLLRFDVSGAEAALSATTEWDLTADLPTTGPNAGIEAVEWVPDDVLTGLGLVDESTGGAYDPDGYPAHGDGVYFVGVEGTGQVYAYLLLDDGGIRQLAAIDPELAGVMALDFDLATGTLWAVCDDGCEGASSLLRVGDDGAFAVTGQVARPAAMANLNSEGFAITPVERCADGVRPVYWTDDDDTDGHSLRAGTLPCPEDPGEPGDDDGSDAGTDDGGAADGSDTGAGDGADAGAEPGGESGADDGTEDGGTLPDTGATAGWLVAGGLLLTLAGFALVAADRRRRAVS